MIRVVKLELKGRYKDFSRVQVEASIPHVFALTFAENPAYFIKSSGNIFILEK